MAPRMNFRPNKLLVPVDGNGTQNLLMIIKDGKTGGQSWTLETVISYNIYRERDSARRKFCVILSTFELMSDDEAAAARSRGIIIL